MKNTENVSLYERFDSAVQQKVDSAAFFLMRHFGWSKTLIRYGLWAFVITTAFTSLFCSYLDRGRVSWAAIIWVIVGIILQKASLKADKRAENSTAVSRTDQVSEPLLALTKKFCWALIFMDMMTTIAILKGTTKLRKMELVAFWLILVGYTAIEYLVRTPKNPPPAKERKTVLVPVRNEN